MGEIAYFIFGLMGLMIIGFLPVIIILKIFELFVGRAKRITRKF